MIDVCLSFRSIQTNIEKQTRTCKANKWKNDEQHSATIIRTYIDISSVIYSARIEQFIQL